MVALDGVRGLAIAMVLGTHFIGNTEATNLFERGLTQLFNYGTLGVDLFFVLSGFLITGILHDSKGAPHYFRNFYVKRSLRIFPLYYAVLAFIFFVLPHVPAAQGPELEEMREHQAWAWLYGINILVAKLGAWAPPYINHFWSLAVEEHFYFAWPLVVWAFGPRALLRISLACVALGLGFRVALTLAGANAIAVYALTPGRLDALCLGAFLAVLARQPGGMAAIQRWYRPAALGVAGLLVLTFVWNRFTEFGVEVLRPMRGTLFAGLLAAVLLTALTAAPGSRVGRFFRSAPMRFFGKYSYGLYVFHAMISHFFVARRTEHVVAGWVGNHTLAVFLQAAAGLALSIGVSWASFHLMEKPFLALKRHFEPAPAAPAPAPGEAQAALATPAADGTRAA
jgi:peptidoglycan/LPS O-acetylase OafA/YrhL